MSDYATNLMASISSSVDAATPDSSPVAESPVVESTIATADSTDVAVPDQPEATSSDDFKFPDESETQEQPAPVEAAPPTEEQDPEDNKPVGLAGITNADGKPLTFRDLKNALVTDKSGAGRELWRGYKLSRELAKPLEQGGIGAVPSIEQLREMHTAKSDMETMAHDFHIGNQANAENFIRQWFAPGENGPTRGGMAVAGNFISTLMKMADDPQSSPQQRTAATQMYVAAGMPVIHQLIGELRSAIPNAGSDFADPEQAQSARMNFANAVRAIERYMKMDPSFSDQDILPLIEKGETATPAVDPRSADLDRKIQEINQWKTQQSQQTNQVFQEQFNGAIQTNLASDTKLALDSLSKAMPARTYAAIEREFVTDVHKQLTSNPASLRAFSRARDIAVQTRSQQDIEAAARAWRDAARPVIKSLRQQYLTENQPVIAAASANRHATAESASQRRGTSSVTHPIGTQPNTSASRQPGESQADYFARILPDKMSRAISAA